MPHIIRRGLRASAERLPRRSARHAVVRRRAPTKEPFSSPAASSSLACGSRSRFASAVTTIHGRSFAGFVVAHLALTVGVCSGLVLLLPTPVSSHGFATTISPVFDCSAAVDSSKDHQLTSDDAELSAPDSDDDDDDAPTGSDAAIAVDPCRTASHGHVIHAVHVEVEAGISRDVDGHALRGPPEDDQTSSDADDIDGDDDDPAAEYSVLLPPATGRASCLPTPAEFVSVSSTRSSALSLRAPPA